MLPFQRHGHCPTFVTDSLVRGSFGVSGLYHLMGHTIEKEKLVGASDLATRNIVLVETVASQATNQRVRFGITWTRIRLSMLFISECRLEVASDNGRSLQYQSPIRILFVGLLRRGLIFEEWVYLLRR